MFAVAAVNTTVLLAVFVLLGVVTAPRVELRSHIYAWATRRDPDWEGFRGSLGVAAGVGAALFALNAIAGLGFGWLFWRRSLEAAIEAHATFHAVLVAVSTAVILAT